MKVGFAYVLGTKFVGSMSLFYHLYAETVENTRGRSAVQYGKSCGVGVFLQVSHKVDRVSRCIDVWALRAIYSTARKLCAACKSLLLLLLFVDIRRGFLSSSAMHASRYVRSLHLFCYINCRYVMARSLSENSMRPYPSTKDVMSVPRCSTASESEGGSVDFRLTVFPVSGSVGNNLRSVMMSYIFAYPRMLHFSKILVHTHSRARLPLLRIGSRVGLACPLAACRTYIFDCACALFSLHCSVLIHPLFPDYF